jgi:hypothetical protein
VLSQRVRCFAVLMLPMPGISFELGSPFIERDGVAEGTDECVGFGEGELSPNSEADGADGVPEKS